MNRDKIIRMAREARLDVYGLGKDHEKFLSVVERFADLIAAAEREECAKVALDYDQHAIAPAAIAAAIRARGQA